MSEKERMKILQIHNHYGGHSGETSVMEKQLELLENNGHQVRTYTRSSEELKTIRHGAFKAFFTALYNPSSIDGITKAIQGFRPDIVHVHNLYPLVSPAILPVIRGMGIPMVMTVHNYRLVCPNGLFYNKGGVCERCSGGKEWHCILQNCEESLPKSIGYAVRNAWARIARQYSENIDAFLCLTNFQKNKLVANGFQESKCHVVPNFIETGLAGESLAKKPGNKPGVLFIGRLNRQKGIDIIVESARRCPEVSFRLAGSVDTSFFNPDRVPPNVQLLGVIDEDQKQSELLQASALVFASRSYEGFPMVFLEAMQQGTPVIAPRYAGYPEVIREGENGWLFGFNDPEDLARTIRKVFAEPGQAESMGRNGCRVLENEYSGEVWYRMYMDIVEKLPKVVS